MTSKYHIAFSCLFLICRIHYGLCWPSGGTPNTCQTMYPIHHHAKAQATEKSPFKVSASSNTYNPGQVITVSIKSDSNDEFEGFVLVCRRTSGDTEELIGEFINLPTGIRPLYWHATAGPNCVTHSDDKNVKSVDVKWKAPSPSVGDVKCWAVVVQEEETFWRQLPSNVIKANVAAVNPAFDAMVSPTVTPAIDVGACGKSKGCMFFPRHCSGTDCDWVVTYQTSTNRTVTFEAIAKAPGFLSIGISHDHHMGEDETYTCLNDGKSVGLFRGYNPARYNSRERVVGTINIQVERKGEHLHCRFTRPLVTRINHDIQYYSYHDEDATRPLLTRPNVKTVTYDLNRDYYLQLAYGDMYLGSEQMGKHISHPVISPDKVNFQSNVIVYGTALPILTKTHGALAIIAWMLFAGMAAIISRYYKGAMAGEFCGLKLWFQLHRMQAVIVMVLSLVSFILIFVQVKAFTGAAVAHAVVGIIMQVLLYGQIAVALFRPGPESSRRNIFNWFHFIVGKLSQVTAGVTLILSAVIPLVPSDLSRILLIVFCVGIVVHILWEIGFEIRRRQLIASKDTPQFAGDIQMEQTAGSGANLTDNSGSGPGWVDHVLLALYGVTMTVFVVTSVVFIFLF